MKALAVAPDGNLFVGGFFNSVNGDTTAHKLVKLNPTTGQRIAAFSGQPERPGVGHQGHGQPGSSSVAGSRSIKNVARDRLAAVDATTGAVESQGELLDHRSSHVGFGSVGLQPRREPGRFQARRSSATS